jgi:hypothetical protein
VCYDSKVTEKYGNFGFMQLMPAYMGLFEKFHNKFVARAPLVLKLKKKKKKKYCCFNLFPFNPVRVPLGSSVHNDILSSIFDKISSYSKVGKAENNQF